MESNRATMTSSSEPGSALTNPERWRAVLARDPDADGRFVYAVRTTGIYCRPTCPSRRPSAGVVTFFTDPDAAEAHGFRPCRRCHPREASDRDQRVELVRAACEILDRHEGRMSLAELSRRTGWSPHHLQRVFTRVTGVSPRAYADARRRGRLAGHLREGRPVVDAMLEAGYGSPSRVYEDGAARLGLTPASYRAGGAGARVRFSVTRSPLGALLVAATARGICAVRLGGSAARLEAELRAEFHAAEIEPAGRSFARRITTVLRHLEGHAPAASLPLDVRATAFQRRVWDALLAIPPGETRGYADIARDLGRPGAQRAVARAIASNPVAVLIPCHRVVPRSGGTGGYRWGAERKRRLLALERGHAGTARGATIRRRARATPRPGAAAAAPSRPGPRAR
jgi:AraC family transcriptional regulator of adaptative response/methylated-DNA-[protein]-cysteine methyltransferase